MKSIKTIIAGLFLGTILFTQNLNAQSITNTVTVAWDAVTTYTDGSLITAPSTVKYNVWRADNVGLNNPVKLNLTELINLQLVDNTLEINKTYYYYITCYVLTGVESDRSDIVTFKTLKPGKAIIRITTN